MSLFVCPVCGRRLAEDDEHRRCFCEKGHSFDRASEGYVNLLTVDRRRSASPGDDKDMARARRAFLDKGFYAPLLETCAGEICRLAGEGAAVLDAGCGEGYYTSGIYEALSKSGKQSRVAGIDISKAAVRMAAKRGKGVEYAVASSFHLPVADGEIDLLFDCFSPLAIGEFGRVIRPGGSFVYVTPSAEHLWELKCAVYDRPYKNEERVERYEGFRCEDIREVRTRLKLGTSEDIAALFAMTPYFWRTPREGAERLGRLESLETSAGFRIHIFRREE